MFGARRKRKGSGAYGAIRTDGSEKAEVLPAYFASTVSPEEQDLKLERIKHALSPPNEAFLLE